MSNAEIDRRIMSEFAAEFIGDVQSDEGYPVVRFYHNPTVRVLVEIGPERSDVAVYTFHKNLS